MATHPERAPHLELDVGAAADPGPARGARWRAVVRGLIDLAAVGAAVGFVVSYFPASVMLAQTTTNGGDMGTHYYPAWYLRYVLLPHGSVIGWCPGNYAGFPLFQFYFPLPFMLMAALSAAVPFEIAFKLVTQLGTALLPICAYFGLRLGGIPFPGPGLAALSTLPFLFMEANSMWGGNIPSTLAGEFAFGLSLSLAVLCLGAIRRTVATGRGRAWAAALVALVGLSHGYTLLWLGFTSLFELVATRAWWRRVGTLAAVYALGVLLMGFFLLELIGYGPWTTAYNHSWPITGWREVLPPILWPSAIAATAATLVLVAVAAVRRTPAPRFVGMLWTAIGTAAFFWFTGHSFHVVDIRFVPFAQLGLGLVAAAALGTLLAGLPLPEIWPAVGAAAILPFVQARVTFVPSWVTWNYSGFERKTTWPVFHDVNERLRGDFRAPRVVYEHSADNESLGTVRAFENLPLFSGRSTLEGLYMQSSPSSPFVFFIQSEVSKDQSCPFPDYGCSRVDLEHGVEHLRMFNVSHYIVRSPLMKGEAAKHPGLVRESATGPFEIYRVRENADRYAIPLTLAPVLVRTPHWKETAYRWFKRATPADPTPIFVDRVTDEAERLFGPAVEDATALPRRPLDDPPPALEEHMDAPDHITVTGCRPGRPVLVRMSYHPRWKSLTGETVWLAGPSFMLVVPKGDRLDLVFDGGGWVTLAHAFTTVGLLVFVAALFPAGRRAGARLAEAALALVPTSVRELGADWNVGQRRTLLAGGVFLFAALVTAAAVAGHVPNSEAVYRAAQKLYDAGRLDESAVLFHQAQVLAPLAGSTVHATYFEAMVHFRQERWRQAMEVLERLLANFPEAVNAPEALYHVGICRARLGDQPGAREAWEQTRARYPNSPWAKYAADRLAELAPRPAG